MSDTDIIRVRIKSPEEMGFLGNAFGTLFVHPLVEGSDRSINNLVVGLYGPKATGKTVFAQNAAEVFPRFSELIRDIPTVEIWNGMETVDGNNRVLRWKDFGYYTGGPDSDPSRNLTPADLSHLSFVEKPFTIRADTLSQTGLDLLEHAPISHLNGGHIVALFGSRQVDDEDSHYFSSTIKGAFSPDAFEEKCKNLRAKEIAGEMRKMNEIMTSHSPQATYPEFEPLCINRKMNNRIWNSIAGKKPRAGHRYVSLMLTTENPEAQRVFRNLKQELAKHCY